MAGIIRNDGWNKGNSAIQELMFALEQAAEIAYAVNNCTVASTYDDADGLLYAVTSLLETLTEAAEGLEEEVSKGESVPSEDDEDEDDDSY